MIARHNKGIGFISLGCAKNLVDSEVLIRQLEAGRYRVVFEPDSLTGIDTMIINTCGFIGDAKQESIDTILVYAEAKKRGEIARLFLMGCLTERYRQELTKEFPEADGIFGVHQLPDILREIGTEYRTRLLGERTITTPSHYAYLKIAEGCDRSCSFCAIPSIRGIHTSKPFEEVIREATYLAATGVKELLVISQDTTFYGIDLYGKRRLAELLQALAGVNGIEWIRLHYAYPHAFPLQVLDVIRDTPTICNYIDIPLQHINDPVLRSMKRGLNGKKTRELIEMIRKKVPGVSIRSTFITGYPGETDKDFDELCDFVSVTGFERMGVFTYSHEEGTPAFRLRDSVPRQIKEQRRAQLMQIQEQISLKRNQELVGEEIKVLVDREETEYYIGRSEADSPEVDQEIYIIKPLFPLRPGNFYKVRITQASHFDLLAEIPQ